MRINIYYGGRGLIEDPTIYAINKITEVLEELRVEVVRYNIYEEKKGLNMLPNTLKEADGVILATTVEWMGIGGLLQQFLDACWLYGDKSKLNGMRMLPVVMSKTYGERDAQFTLVKAWELLGGVPVDGICAYVENHAQFETNEEYAFLMEKKTEELYRQISHKLKCFPTSINVVTKSVLQPNTLELTPQESEQLSIYASDDSYVKKQKEDIQELAQLFKGMLGEDVEEEQRAENRMSEKEPGVSSVVSNSTKTVSLKGTPAKKTVSQPRNEEYVSKLRQNFKGQNGIKATYCLNLEEDGRNLLIEVDGAKLDCYYGEGKTTDVLVKLNKNTMEDILNGTMTLQRAFMSGVATAKGDFKTLRNFDTIFRFL